MFIRFEDYVCATVAAGALSLANTAVAGAGGCKPSWTPGMFPAPPEGLNAGVNAFALFDDGSGSGLSLYAGGRFRTGGGIELNSIAKWTGASWEPLGTGMDSSSAGIIAQVYDLEVFDDGAGNGPALYASGDFVTAGGVVVNGVAKWDGSNWSGLGTGLGAMGVGIVPYVYAMTVFDDGSGAGPALYAGGRFTSAGGVEASRIAKWDGASWSAVGTGVNSDVMALTVFDDGSGTGPALFAGGRFTIAGEVSANRVARWDGASWSALGTGVSIGNFPAPIVYALASFDDGSGGGPALYAGGGFGSAGSMPAINIARWDGASWSTVGSGMIGGAVNALTVFDDGAGNGPALYVGGSFFGAGGNPASRVARWDGAAWTPLGTGLSAGGELPFVGALFAIENDGGTPALYAGGAFTAAGGTPSWFVARWAGCSSAQPPCPGDANGDGVVNFTDLNAVLADFGQAGMGLTGDVTADGEVNFADLNLVLSNFGVPCTK